MQSSFLQIILDEIAAEGLEGVTLECLWKYLSVHNYFKKVDFKYQAYLWKFIVNFKEINFYKLNEPRACNFKIQDRYHQYKYSQDAFLESNVPPYQLHTLQVLSEPDVYGSCTSFNNRILIDDEIKSNSSCSYSDIVQKYGNNLVIVANQKCRFRFLGLEDSENNKDQIGKIMYAFLEFIGRSRYHGVKVVGKFSVLEFLKDSQSIWFLKRKLKNKNLIRFQKMNFLKENNSINDIMVFQITRFYRPWYNIIETDLERFLLYCTTVSSSGILKSTFLETLGFSEEFLKLAKKLGWIDIIITTYRVMNYNVDIDQIPSDEQLLKCYIEDFQLPNDEPHSMSLINRRSCFIKPVKTLSDLKEHMEKRLAICENDDEPTDDVLLSINDIGLNLDESVNTQVLKMLAHQPMNASEIKKATNMNKNEVRSILRFLSKTKQVSVNFQTIKRHSIPFYSINQSLFKQFTVPATIVKEPTEVVEENLTIESNGLSQSPVNIKNPKRKERYEFLLNMIRMEIILSDYLGTQNKIREWEASLNRKEVMDRKSFKRILEDAITNKCAETMEVVIETLKCPITETWIVLPGTSRDSPIFQQHYLRRVDALVSKDKNIKVVEKSSVKKKKVKVNPLDYSSQINIFREIKDTTWIDEQIDFKLPEVPIMLRRKLLHEFLWYICIGCHEETRMNFRPEFDELGFKVYMNFSDWRRHVAPLQPDSADKFISFSLNDVLLRMPLFLLCLWTLPKTCNQELYDALADESLRWATLENLILCKKSLVAFVLNSSNKLGLSKLTALLESMLNMGLITKRDQPKLIKFKNDALYYLNQHVFLTDTSKFRLPISDEAIWAKFPRYQWILKSEADLINYWENIYNVCTNTRCGEIGCKSNAIQILANHNQEFIRNTDYIIRHVVKNGPISIENAQCINQFGAWLPGINNIKWKHLGPGGFSLSLSSWAMVTWCLDRFEKICSEPLEPVTELFRQFQRSLFIETITTMNSYTHISSLNENLSLILNEINIILTGAEILRYLDNLEVFWNRIRLKKWFKSSFTHIFFRSFNGVQRYIRQLTPEFEKERKELIIESMNFKEIAEHSKIDDLKEYRRQFQNREANVIRILLLTLLKLHRFIPQWSIVDDHKVEVIKELKGPLKTEEVHLNGLDVINEVPIISDNTNTVADIVMLSLKKYLMGCMSPYKESYWVNIDQRNKVLLSYSKDMLLATLNDFKNFYVNEPLKNSNSELIKSGVLDRRLDRLSKRLLFRHPIESMVDNFNRHWKEWARFPEMECYESNSTRKHKFEYNLQKCTATDVMGLMGIVFAIERNEGDYFGDSMDLIMSSDNSLSDQTKFKTKSVCYSSVYNINMKMKNISRIDWNKLTSGAKIVVNLTDVTYQNLFMGPSKNKLWNELSEYQSVPELENCRKRLRSSKKSDFVSDILEYIEDGEFGGRSYDELKKKFSHSKTILPELKNLLAEKTICIVGINSFHFVSQKYIKPWAVKVPSATHSDSKLQLTTQRKRKGSISSPSHNQTEQGPQYFLPEFYRGEQGEFKCVTFAEIIKRLYEYFYKNPCSTLDVLINEFSSYLGEVVVKKLVDVLSQYEILKLATIKVTGKCGWFTKRIEYEELAFNPFDNEASTTVTLNPLSFIKMDHLIVDMSKYFSVNLDEYIT